MEGFSLRPSWRFKENNEWGVRKDFGLGGVSFDGPNAVQTALC